MVGGGGAVIGLVIAYGWGQLDGFGLYQEWSVDDCAITIYRVSIAGEMVIVSYPECEIPTDTKKSYQIVPFGGGLSRFQEMEVPFVGIGVEVCLLPFISVAQQRVG